MANVAKIVSGGDGTAISAGFIGENNAVFGSGNVSLAASNTPKTVVSVNLGPGVWLCQATIRLDKGTSDATFFGVGVSDTNNTMLLGYQTLGAALTGTATIYASPTIVFTKSSSWTLYAVGNVIYTTLGAVYDGSTSNIKYLRIA